MTPNPLRLKYPIVLVHGLGAKARYGPVDYFYGLPKLLRDAGNEVFIADLTALHTMEHRAKELKEQIEHAFPDPSQTKAVNIIGHSFGGLDARFLVSNLRFADRVASVTTIGSPNRGSIMADLTLGLLPEKTIQFADLVLALAKSSTKAYQQVSNRYCSEVLSVVAPNMPNVAYFSATSAIQPPVTSSALPVFWIPHRIIQRYEGDNDGFVSVESAKWGTHICTYYGDHYAQIGQFLGYSRGLNYINFYNEIIRRLKKEGF